MFIDIWNKENKAIKINKFEEDILNISKRSDALHKIIADYGLMIRGNDIIIDYYRIEFKNTNEDGFNQTLNFAVLIDCFMFLLSDTFAYLFESEDIDFIQITAGKKVMFKYDNRNVT